ncbi:MULTISPECIES: hypothetical protein [unclassified Frigoribacterium]|uniref:hypothetical protein n=1 Tax=unclassified Frigoribacterium TaxID=2627005 RepID=UPI0012FCDDAB|nr:MULTISPECIES: hypothetical protein [unclassified Frigoribacterium]
MESNHAQSTASARDALRGLEGDRLELARRTRSPRWYYPGLALFTAAIPLAPLAGGVWVFVVIAFACLGLVGLERAFVLATGISTNRVPGPRSLIVLVVMGIVVLTMVFVSGLAVNADSTAWALTAGAVSFLVMFPGGYVYDHFYGQELRRGV